MIKEETFIEVNLEEMIKQKERICYLMSEYYYYEDIKGLQPLLVRILDVEELYNKAKEFLPVSKPTVKVYKNEVYLLSVYKSHV